MRFTLLFMLSIVIGLNAFGQDSERIQKDRNGNVIAIFGSQDSSDQKVEQRGVENIYFIYSTPDSLMAYTDANQLGLSNRIISVLVNEKGSIFQRYDQNGERNRIDVLQVISSDSTGRVANEVDIKQKGSGNSVTIIQE